MLVPDHPQPSDSRPIAFQVKLEAAGCKAPESQAPLVEAATGQAVAEAALALMWAVLSGPAESGETLC